MEILLNLTPIEFYIKGEARLGAYRLRLNNSWWPTTVHTRIERTIALTSLEMRSDYQTPKFFLDKLFKVTLDWELGRELKTSYNVIWYVDGSKNKEGTGAPLV